MSATYQTDVIAWANEQAALLRSGNLSAIDIEHIAEEIEDVGKSEQRELANRMAVLLAHLLKWTSQPERRGASWRLTIKAQRKEIGYNLIESPSLRTKIDEFAWLDVAWAKAAAQAAEETGLDIIPEVCPWTVEQILSQEFFPD